MVPTNKYSSQPKNDIGNLFLTLLYVSVKLCNYPWPINLSCYYKLPTE